MADVSSYKVMSQHGQSRVLQQNWLLLITSEVGVPLCMGNHHTWDRCTSPTPCKTTFIGGDGKRIPQEKDARQSPNNLQVKLPWGGKMGSCSLDHGYLLEHPLRTDEDHSKVIWLQTLEGTCT